jgi:anti-sigma-K factor RskA
MSQPRDQISSYLLGEQSAAQAAEFERQLAADPELRTEVERLRPVVARLEGLPAEVWEPVEPPPLTLPGDAAGAEPAGNPKPRRRLPRVPALSLRPLPATALAVALLALGVVAGLAIGDGDSGAPPTTADLSLSRIDDGPRGASGEVLVAGDGAQATLDVAGLDPSAPNRFYELWLLDDDGRMIALGSFQVGDDGQAQVELPIPVEPSRYRYFDVSLQEDNGDPAHSGVSVLRGPTSS